MKIGFYNPYFDSLSGGERYVLTLAAYWSKTHDVSLFWDDTEYIKKAEERFHIDLSAVKIVKNVFKTKSFLEKVAAAKAFDCIFFLSDGSVPYSSAKRNILHFQVPFKKILFPWWKRMRYKAVVVNSEFTKKTIDKNIGKGACVIYPPVDISNFPQKKKRNVIISIGRFSSYFQAKKQEILIEAFKKGYESGKLKGWKLVLAGGVLPTDASYLVSLKNMSEGVPIELLPNCSFKDLQDMYGCAALYWHAAGYGEEDPTKMEHFGITTVEAMSAGCVPLVYDAGGQPEIVKDARNGYLWKTIDELIEKTVFLVKNKNQYKKLQTEAEISAKAFSVDVFTKAFDTLLSSF